MKLDSEKKVLLCQKALYAEQLNYYKRLCETYKKFANHSAIKENFTNEPNYSVSDKVQDNFGIYLSQATAGNFSFIDRSPLFDKEQKQFLHDYHTYSSEIKRFQDASAKLQDATYYNGTFDIDPSLLDEYHDFMQEHETTKDFDDLITHSKTSYIGHHYYQNAMNNINRINKIDPTHLTSISARAFTPKSFGATISGFRGRFNPLSRTHMENVVQSDLSSKDIEKFEQPITNLEKAGEVAHALGSMAVASTKEFYTAHKGTIEKALKKAALIGLALGMVYVGSKGVEKLVDAHEFNKEAYMGNPAYEQTVNDETMQMMQELDEYLTSLENSSSIPTADQLRQATELVDNSGNMIMDSLIRNSFSSQFENLKIPEGGVVIHYNKNHDNMSDGSLGNYVYITCQDENGKEYQYVIKDFRSQGDNRVKRLFNDERNIDEQRKDIGDVYNDNFTMNSQNAKKYLADLREMYNNNVELAGSLIVIDSPQINYDNAKANDEESLGDKFRLEMAKIFCIDAKLKTVTPEKVENEPQETLSVETIETSNTTPEHENDKDDDAR